MNNNQRYLRLSGIIALILPGVILGADAAVAPQSEDNLNINLMLEIIAVVMLIPLFLTTKTFLLSINNYSKKKQELIESTKKTCLLILLMGFVFSGYSQVVPVVQNPDGPAPESMTWLLASIVVVEALLVIFFSWQTFRLLKMPVEIATAPLPLITPVRKKSKFIAYWEKVNNFKNPGDEDEIDTGHNYDGIRELDNVTPPWFTTAFMLSIIFAVVYLWRYHVSKSAPLQLEEYAIEMAEADAEKTKLLASQANNVDENTVTMLSGPDIQKGQALFTQKCAPCHGDNGGSKPGGVGPNLTDKYWLHGGSLKDVFKSIKYGWTDKGMIAWNEQLSPIQIAQVASFIQSINGSNPSGSKEPQGDLFTETVTDSSAVIIKDSALKQ
ncbi:MAG: cbb3-type cytochrome c oxidase N-terminal domain-containing protein [Bacteroidota bacterium]